MYFCEILTVKKRMTSAAYFIDKLKLTPHPEGGYYKEIYYSNFEVKNIEGNYRAAITSIYYLLEKGNTSAPHRIKSDEIWYYHAGSPLELYAFDRDGDLHTWTLGSNLEKGEVMQVCMEEGWIFGARCSEGFSLVGCAVAPGFHFCDFELINKEYLLREFPKQKEFIEHIFL